MTSRADILQKMRDAAANGAFGKVEWCAGWLRGYGERHIDVPRLAAAIQAVIDENPAHHWHMPDEQAADIASAYERLTPQTSPQSDPTLLDAWQDSARGGK